MRPTLFALFALAVAGVCAAVRPAAAHGMRSAYLEITQTAPDRARIVISGKVPVTGIELHAAAPCRIESEAGTWLSCPEQIAGAELSVTGLGTIVSEAVIFVVFLDGTSTSGCATAGHASWTVPGPGAGALSVARRYVALGIEHIATGADHLLFLLALVLCLRTFRAVMLAETAFTLSHTLSFSASALGWVHVSAPAAEACIAVSLVLVALDVGRPRGDATRCEAWRTAGLAFAFGLVHGLGFAGGLAEIGLPPSAVPAALVGFAGGVELGQVAFLVIAVSALSALRRTPRLARTAVWAGGHAIGAIAWFWLLERLGALGSS